MDAQTDAVRRVLAERAAVLALQAEERDRRHGKELVVFCLGDSLYAIAARWVRAVHPLRSHSRLPWERLSAGRLPALEVGPLSKHLLGRWSTRPFFPPTMISVNPG